MSSQPIPAPAAAPDGDTRYYRQVLHDLIDMGTELARAAHKRAMAQAEAGPSGDTPTPGLTPSFTIDFDRIARTVRQTVLLAQKLDQPAPRPRTAPDPAAARRQIIRKVEDRIHDRARGPRAEALHAEMMERLDAPEFAHDLATRPIIDIIDEIRRDMGLDDFPGMASWKRRTPADIATLHARAAGHPVPPPITPAAPPDPSPTDDPPDLDSLIQLAHTLIGTG